MATASTRSRKTTGTVNAVSVSSSSSKTVTFEVVKPFCGLEKGERRTVELSSSITETERLGFIKFI